MKKNIVLSLLCASMLLSSTAPIFADHHKEIADLRAKNAQYEQEIKDLKEQKAKKGWGYWAGVGTGTVGTAAAFFGIFALIKNLTSSSNNSTKKN